jgi:hypothetical protein
MVYKRPKDGYVVNDPNHGSIFIGSDKGVKGVERPRQVSVQSASGATLKLFEDGGFEIHGQPSATIADNIASTSKHGLMINGRNIHLTATDTFTISARAIVFEGTGGDQNCTIRSNGNLTLQAEDTLALKAAVIGACAKTRMLLQSKGQVLIKSKTGISLIEPQTPLTPMGIFNTIESLASSIFGGDC